jgi:hypothetical protein
MSILTSTTSRPEITEEQLLKFAVSGITQFSKKSYEDLLQIQKRGIDILWKNGRLTPQQIVDALGDSAVKIFQMHGILTSALQQIAQIDGISADVALPTHAFEIVDGKIVVSDDPYIA